MSSFILDMGDILKNLVEKEVKTMAALNLYGDSVAKEMESYAKTRRVWTDRTSHARNALNGDSFGLKDMVRCEISHGVDYGIYLEMCNERRFAILDPTIKAVGPKALKGLSKIFK